MEPVEHADDHEQRAVAGLSASMPSTTSIRRPRRPQRPPGSAPRRPCPARGARARAVAIATSVPSGPRAGSARRRPGSRRRGGRTGRGRRPDLGLGQRDVREASRPASMGRRSGAERRGPLGGGRAHVVERRARRPRAERPGRRPAQRPEVGGTAEALPRSRASARTYVPAEQSHRAIATGRSGSESSQSTRSSAWMVTSRSASSTVSPARAIA